LTGRLSRVAAEYLQYSGRPREAAPYVDIALRMSDLADDPETLARAMNLLAVQQSMLGSVEVSRLLYAGMVEVSRRNELWNPLTIALANEACLLAGRDLVRSVDLLQQSVVNQAEHGLPRLLGIESNLVVWYWLAGRWADLDELLATSAVPASDSSLMAKKAAGTDLLMVWAGAREHRLVERFPGEETPLVPGLVVAECYRRLSASLATGDRGGAVAPGQEMVTAELAMNDVTDDLHALWPLAVRAALGADDLTAVGALLEQLAPYVDRALPTALRAHRSHARALVEMRGTAPDDQAIVAGLEGAIADLAFTGNVVWEAHAHEDLGVWHLSQGRDAASQRHLDIARATYAGLGAQRWLERLDAVRRPRSELPAG
jgi:hypothetical protein